MVGRCIEIFRSEILTSLMGVISFLGDGVIIPVLFVAVVSIFFYSKKEKIVALLLPLSALIGQLIKAGLKNLYQVPRPEAFGCRVLTEYRDLYSFPSGHTIFYTIVFGWLIFFSIKNLKTLWAKFLITFSICFLGSVGFSRIYLGAHWYLDVFVGYFVGGIVFLMSYLIFKYLKGQFHNGK